MSRTIESIAAHLVPVKRPALTARARQFTANWQDGFESGGQVQRKLRLTFTAVAARQPEH